MFYIPTRPIPSLLSEGILQSQMYPLPTNVMALDRPDSHFLDNTGLDNKTLNTNFYLSKVAPYFCIKISISTCTSKNGKKYTISDCPYEALGP